ncbi:hypothetical protein BDW22DRAFT_1423822 [Trametopsis cervina]|nr:hypothetical protein BDW22DRAFT_1423822 [Trametopsis cervina]
MSRPRTPRVTPAAIPPGTNRTTRAKRPGTYGLPSAEQPQTASISLHAPKTAEDKENCPAERPPYPPWIFRKHNKRSDLSECITPKNPLKKTDRVERNPQSAVPDHTTPTTFMMETPGNRTRGWRPLPPIPTHPTQTPHAPVPLCTLPGDTFNLSLPPPSPPPPDTASHEGEDDDSISDDPEGQTEPASQSNIHYPHPPWTNHAVPPDSPLRERNRRDTTGLSRPEEGEIVMMDVDFFDDGARLPIYTVTTRPGQRIGTGVTVQLRDAQQAGVEPPTELKGIYAMYRDHYGFWASDEDGTSESLFAIIIKREWTSITWWEWVTRAAQPGPLMDIGVLLDQA